MNEEFNLVPGFILIDGKVGSNSVILKILSVPVCIVLPEDT
jgi:hypothetical protein